MVGFEALTGRNILLGPSLTGLKGLGVPIFNKKTGRWEEGSLGDPEQLENVIHVMSGMWRRLNPFNWGATYKYVLDGTDENGNILDAYGKPTRFKVREVWGDLNSKLLEEERAYNDNVWREYIEEYKEYIAKWKKVDVQAKPMRERSYYE